VSGRVRDKNVRLGFQARRGRARRRFGVGGAGSKQEPRQSVNLFASGQACGGFGEVRFLFLAFLGELGLDAPGFSAQLRQRPLVAVAAGGAQEGRHGRAVFGLFQGRWPPPPWKIPMAGLPSPRSQMAFAADTWSRNGTSPNSFIAIE